MGAYRAEHFPAGRVVIPGLTRPLVSGRWTTRTLLRRGAQGSLLMVLALGALEANHLRNLSAQIAPVFESELWSFPSKVYSRPFDLRPGLRVQKGHVVARLGRLGYTESPGTPRHPGQYRVLRSGLEIYGRDFELPSGPVRGRAARVTFSKDRVVSSLSELPSGASVETFAIEPEVLATLHGNRAEDRTVLRLSEFPDSLVQAVVASEDRRFFRHRGLDPLRIVRAMWTNLRRGQLAQGASTITQQTVRNLFLGPERTWSRKLREAQMALALESRYPKTRILEVYLNEVYLGQREGLAVCGFAEAARFYFGKDVRDLDVAESALLAAIIPAPAMLNPLKYPERVLPRRNLVLKAMLQEGKITEEAYGKAIAEVPRLATGSKTFRSAPCFVQFVRGQLRALRSDEEITRGGLRVFTTLDTRVQQIAEEALLRGLDRLERERPRLKRRGRRPLEGAVIVLHPGTGEVLASVGGRDFAQNQFDHALLARRQTGSLFKPLVYLAGFDRASQDPGFLFTPATILDDSPIEIAFGVDVWSPRNYDGEFRGPVTVRAALEQSLNVPAVVASQEVGLGSIVSLANRCGIRSRLPVYPSIALGSHEATLLEMATAYSVIANGGYAVLPTSMLEVIDRKGAVHRGTSLHPHRVVSEAAAFLALDLMRGVIDRGTAHAARAAGVQGDFAGKTGTTNDKRDSWFIGFAPDLLVAVWVGFDDNDETGLTGAGGALPIWIDFIQSIGYSPSPAAFPEPLGVARVPIDPTTGGLATDQCPEVLDEVFVLGTEPQEPCPEHGSGLLEWVDGVISDRAPYLGSRTTSRASLVPTTSRISERSR